MLAIWWRELRAYFQSPFGYISMGLFLVLFGITVTFSVAFPRSPLYGGVLAQMRFMLIFVIPVLTMRLFTEERRLRTDQLLLTVPLQLPDIVLGKFAAAMTVLVVMLLITVTYPVALSFFGELPVGETGELAARGPRIMRGYWQADAEALPGGWLRLGDLGYIDEDGYIYLQGRAKDFIKRGGEMVSPEEVENALYQHPGVDECAVIGVPDETWGERVVAVVVAKPDAAPTEDALLDLATERLARFKRPEQVVFVDALPRNDLGKVLKRELREQLSAG